MTMFSNLMKPKLRYKDLFSYKYNKGNVFLNSTIVVLEEIFIQGGLPYGVKEGGGNFFVEEWVFFRF